jgi:hypothetical protein
MGVEDAFRFNDYVGALLAETVTASEIYLGKTYPLACYFFLERLVNSARTTRDAPCTLTNEDGTLVFHAILHLPDP